MEGRGVGRAQSAPRKLWEVGAVAEPATSVLRDRGRRIIASLRPAWAT